jgi:hypothetical protein
LDRNGSEHHGKANSTHSEALQKRHQIPKPKEKHNNNSSAEHKRICEPCLHKVDLAGRTE